MNSQKFDLSEAATSTPNSNFVPGNIVTNNVSYIYQQTPRSTQHISSLYNSTDEYHTANEESFKAANNSMNSSIIQQNPNTTGSNLSGGQAIMTTPTSTTGPTTMAARKQMVPVDMSEPTKPLSAYALFFRDTVSAIKQQNPSCSFPELSKIVSSMWDALDSMHKGVYIKKNELARTEYLKQLKNYQQQLQQKQTQMNTSNNEVQTTNINDQQQQLTQQSTLPAANNINVPQNLEQINNNNMTAAITAIPVANVSSSSAAPPDDAIRLPESSLVQKCTRENCNKRAIISPDWEDEYCSNECVIMHCRNVFNVWVQSNLEAKQQDQLKQQAPAI